MLFRSKALKVVVESNVAITSGDPAQVARLPESVRQDHIPQELAAENVAFLRTQVESWLAVLFNVFSTVGRDGQGPVGDVITAWAALADAKVGVAQDSGRSDSVLVLTPSRK